MGVVAIGGLLTQGVIADFNRFIAGVLVVKQSPNVQETLSGRIQRGMFCTKILENIHFGFLEALMGFTLTDLVFLLYRFGTRDKVIRVMPVLGLHLGGRGGGIGFGAAFGSFGRIGQRVAIGIHRFEHLFCNVLYNMEITP